MNFDYVVESVSQEFGGQKVTKSLTKAMVQAIFEEITECLSRGQSVGVRGFGTFEVTEKKGRAYREPRNQTLVMKPPCNYPKFRPSGLLKKAVNGEEE